MRIAVRIIFKVTDVICLMTTLSRPICDFIANEWISKAKSNRAFAIEHNIDEKTVRRILEDPKYSIQLETLAKICEAKSLKLWEFFKLLGV